MKLPGPVDIQRVQEFPYLERLQAAGLTPDAIDFVCCTHLHGDPDAARITRLRLLEHIADTDTELLGAHFPGPTALRVVIIYGFFHCRVLTASWRLPVLLISPSGAQLS